MVKSPGKIVQMCKKKSPKKCCILYITMYHTINISLNNNKNNN